VPSIIDSLIVELKLDPTKFDEGTKQSVESLRKMEDGAQKHTKAVNDGFTGLINTFKEFQGRLLAVGAIIAAGLGFNRLIQDTMKLNSELGYMSASLGVSAQEMSKWQQAGATVGAQAQDIAQSFAVIKNSLADMQLGKGSFLNEFARTTHQQGQGPAVELYNPNGTQRESTDILLDISRWYQAQQNKAVASRLMEQIGFGRGMINMLQLGPDELKKRLNEAQQFAPTNEQIKKFQELQEQFGKLEQVMTALANAVASRLAPVLTEVLKIINQVLSRWYSGENPADVTADTLAKGGFSELKPNPAKPSLSSRLWNWLRGGSGSAPAEGSAAPEGGAAPENESMWGRMRRRLGLGGGGAASGGGGGQGAANDNGSTGGASAAVGEGSSEYLRDRRQRYLDEVNNTPGLRDRVGGMLALEGTPQATMEAMLNRMDYVNSERRSRGLPDITIDQMLHSGFYGPINNGRLSEGIASYRQNQARYDRAMSRAFGGSHVIGGFTDQGLPSDPNGWRQPQARVGDNVFPDWNGGARFAAGDYRNAAAYRQRVEAAIARERREANAPPGARFPSWMPTVGGSATNDNAAGRSFQRWQDLGLGGARGALSRGGDTTTNNTNTSSTSIGEMHVTVPHGADPAAYGAGIRQELQRFDNVQQANTGLR
jgi:hypothetical protein